MQVSLVTRQNTALWSGLPFTKHANKKGWDILELAQHITMLHSTETQSTGGPSRVQGNYKIFWSWWYSDVWWSIVHSCGSCVSTFIQVRGQLDQRTHQHWQDIPTWVLDPRTTMNWDQVPEAHTMCRVHVIMGLKVVFRTNRHILGMCNHVMSEEHNWHE